MKGTEYSSQKTHPRNIKLCPMTKQLPISIGVGRIRACEQKQSQITWAELINWRITTLQAIQSHLTLSCLDSEFVLVTCRNRRDDSAGKSGYCCIILAEDLSPISIIYTGRFITCCNSSFKGIDPT